MRRFIPVVFMSLLLVACSQSSKLTANNNRTYVVFFPFASAELDDASVKTIDQAVKYAKHFPQKQVYVEGYAAVYGDLSVDEMLAAQRAKVVAQKITQDGISADRVHDTPRPPEDRKSQIAARRVEIEVK
ncbi:OmpA family protein [Commensalibacter oyaizuii]|uniref:OmpA family protein n=1 Tax=Commensalibacter oyaizuii TaxID=3043873 RepID=A0ABT6PZ51_9PROT|nr:OmpA family protein [Commensalibacter sp. TBRC 16381]MDI2090137.1 OmpA family protein [Commensalibacter sp. TBRC 16381]